MNQKTKTAISRWGKIYVIGIALVCGFLLTSVDDCESMYFTEQLRAREQAMKEEQERAAKAEQERIAAANKSNAQPAQGQTGTGQTNQSGSSSSVQTGTGGTAEAASGSTAAAGTQSSTGGTTSTSGTQTATGGTAASSSAQDAVGGSIAPSNTQAAAAAGSTGANYVTSISGKSWKLTELRFSDRTVVLNRNELSSSDADIFTMTIDGERINGRGAPNRYFTAYQAGANNALTIQPIASTMMAAIITEPQRIQESEYFLYLGKVKNWRLAQNKLELVSADKANKSLVMVYSN